MRNILNLKHFSTVHQPDLIFLSEPQIYQNDVELAMKYLIGEYNYSLNSEDVLDPDLPLIKSKANGGTMLLWKQSLDPYISIHPVSSTSILPIIFSPPDSPTSIHVSVYLPTHGQDSRFVEDLATLLVCLDDLHDVHPEAPIFIRGDFNVSDRNLKRTELFDNFCTNLNLTQVLFSHKSYHHFTGNGKSDSNLDKLLFSKSLNTSESLKVILCKLSNPAVDSHHDVIISSFNLPLVEQKVASSRNVVAPKIENHRTKVFWSDSGIEGYQDLVVPELERIQQLWSSDSSSKTPPPSSASPPIGYSRRVQRSPIRQSN